jgi:hypothetical protein
MNYWQLYKLPIKGEKSMIDKDIDNALILLEQLIQHDESLDKLRRSIFQHVIQTLKKAKEDRCQNQIVIKYERKDRL